MVKARLQSRLLLRVGILAPMLALEYIIYFFEHVHEDYRFFIGRWAVAFGLFFFFFGYPQVRSWLRFACDDSSLSPVSFRFLLLHTGALAVFLTVASPALATRFSGHTLIADAVWSCTGISAVLFAGMAFVPARVWYDLLRITGKLWIYAAATAGTVTAMAPVLWRIWKYSDWRTGTDLTFWIVRQVLGWFVTVIVADLPTHVIGTDRFAVSIGGVCSGWEGLSLAAIFVSASLWLSRREYRFPIAFILIPGAVVSAFVLNAVRIAALILIGHYGAPEVAVGGFHSQAGWIAFSGIALVITLIGQRARWLRAPEPGDLATRTASDHNPAVPFLLPFAAALATGMISIATSNGFERLYPLRFFATAATLWFYRREYGFPCWRPDWFSASAGALVFAVWLAIDRGSHPGNGIAAGLARMSALGRISWLFFRVLAGITTVPLAEELAFRGFLFRRIISVEFQSVGLGRLSYTALIGSSLAFGFLHGERWIAGTCAGLVYAAVMIRRGRMSDAVVAHAATNALVAVWVWCSGNWYFW